MNDMFDLKGKTALVTGGSQGIGRAVSLLLAQCGAKVIVNWRSNDALADELFKELDRIGADYVPWKYDISSDSIRSDFERFASDRNLTVDILVSNASVQIRRNWAEISNDDFDIQMHTNFRACLALIQACVPGMKDKHWGRIVTIGSVQQYRPNLSLTIYAAAKAAQMSMVRTLSTVLAPDGITVNNLAPGCIETGRNSDVLSDPSIRESVENSIPAGYVGKPDDIAPAVLLLCSEEGRYFNGADIPVDGGMSIPFTKTK